MIRQPLCARRNHPVVPETLLSRPGLGRAGAWRTDLRPREPRDRTARGLGRPRRAPAARRKARRRSALPPSARSPRGIFELRDAFAADRLDDARQYRYALAEPVQLFLRDAIMFRVARLHIGFLQLLEHCAVTLMLARPCVKQAQIGRAHV